MASELPRSVCTFYASRSSIAARCGQSITLMRLDLPLLTYSGNRTVDQCSPPRQTHSPARHVSASPLARLENEKSARLFRERNEGEGGSAFSSLAFDTPGLHTSGAYTRCLPHDSLRVTGGKRQRTPSPPADVGTRPHRVATRAGRYCPSRASYAMPPRRRERTEGATRPSHGRHHPPAAGIVGVPSARLGALPRLRIRISALTARTARTTPRSAHHRSAPRACSALPRVVDCPRAFRTPADTRNMHPYCSPSEGLPAPRMRFARVRRPPTRTFAFAPIGRPDRRVSLRGRERDEIDERKSVGFRGKGR
ncbi:hypothetical protein C8R44DRAFT_845044 [Mycena epipterygia]|nr:hypothetical protein C8R44DRAFT_845044 [Mycena epipterygia]